MTGVAEGDFEAYGDIWSWNDISPDVSTRTFEWKNYYNVLFIANSIIEKGDGMDGGTTEEKEQLLGEAYMLRALSHFTLVNLFAVPYRASTAAVDRGIPLKLNSNTEDVLSRNSVQEVYDVILSDLEEAQKYLNVETWETGLNYRFNTLSVDAFRSRVFLYVGNWKESLAASQRALSKKSALLDLSAGSAGNPPNHYASVESIVAFEPIFTASYRGAARIASDLLAAYVTGDRRRANFYTAVTASVYELKKGGSIDFRCSFRTGELYLNAAEAAVQDSDTEISVAQQYLLSLLEKRFSANLYNTKKTEIEAMDKASLLREIYLQRYLELAFEGHRWFDLRRTTQQRLIKTYKGVEYVLEEGDSRYTIPIPAEAIENNPNLAN